MALTQFELQPNFHMFIYIYVQYTYYQWVKHGLIFLKLCAASSSSPPLSKLSPLSAEAYSPPAQPRPNLNAVPHICTKMTLGCAFKAATKVAPSFASRRLPLPPAAYISLHCTVTPTAPPDCSQTRLKTDQQTTPQTDSVYLSEQPHQNCETS